MIRTQMNNIAEKSYQSQKGRCPSCGANTVLEYLGLQEWPARVAEAMGFDGVVTLWRCTSCYTTVTIKRSDLE